MIGYTRKTAKSINAGLINNQPFMLSFFPILY